MAVTNPLRLDPTRTKLLRDKFERDLRRRFKRLDQSIFDLVVAGDVFGLSRRRVPTFNAREWSFLTDERKLQEFEGWLANETGLTIVPEGDRYWEQYTQQGYEKGAGRAFTEANRKRLAAATGRGVEEFGPEVFMAGRKAEFLRGMLGAPESIEKVKLLAARTFTDLKGVNEVMATQIRKELADGLVQGQNPRTIARNMSIRSSTSLKHAERIARTEIVRAHAEGQLDALERMGVTEVGVSVEWSTAGDTRVCPLCAELEGVVLKVKEAHMLIPRHPNCRCAFTPANVGESTRGQVRSKSAIDKAFDDSIKQEGSKKRSLQQAKDRSRWAGKSKRVDKVRPKSILQRDAISRDTISRTVKSKDVTTSEIPIWGKTELKGEALSRKLQEVGVKAQEGVTSHPDVANVIGKQVNVVRRKVGSKVRNWMESNPVGTKVIPEAIEKGVPGWAKKQGNKATTLEFFADEMRTSAPFKKRMIPGEWTFDDTAAGHVRHEYGHFIHFEYVGRKDTTWSNLFTKYKHNERISAYGRTDAEEMFAECFSMVTHPKYRISKKEGWTQGLPKDIEKYFTDKLGIEP